LVAQGTLLTFGIVLLQMAHSATAIACFILGGGLMLATGLRAITKRPARVHVLCLGIVLVGGVAMLFGGGSALSSALGRGSGLSGRTDIWNAALAAADNPLIGTGFESFWNANAHKVARTLTLLGFLDMSNLVSAHNGYIEVYLDIGLVGVGLLVLVLISGYRRAGEAFRRDRELGSLILAYLVTGVFYSITEAGFRLLSPSWIFLLLALVSANGVASRRRSAPRPLERFSAAAETHPFVLSVQAGATVTVDGPVDHHQTNMVADLDRKVWVGYGD
jgi:O-antigen ligase